MKDLFQGYSFGYELSIANETIPTNFGGQYNLKDHVLDDFISDFYFSSVQFSNEFSKLLNLILEKDGSDITQVCRAIGRFEKILLHHVGKFESSLNIEDPVDQKKVIKRQFSIKNHLGFCTFLVALFWQLFLHFETHDRNLSFFYLTKVVAIATDVLNCFPRVAEERRCEFVFYPAAEKFINRVNQVFLGLAIRFSLYNCNSIKLVNSIKDSFILWIQATFSTLSDIPQAYVNARRIISVYTILLNELNSMSSVFERLDCPFTSVQLQELTNRTKLQQAFDMNKLRTSDPTLEVMNLDFDVKDRILDFDHYFDIL